MRIVYDCSVKREGNISSNDCLEQEPCMLPKIFDILVRFRSYKYSVVSDIKSAFLNIRFVDNFRNYLRFLWFDNILDPNPSLVIMRFTSVIIDLTCSPFLFMKTIEKHMNQYADIRNKISPRFIHG